MEINKESLKLRSHLCEIPEFKECLNNKKNVNEIYEDLTNKGIINLSRKDKKPYSRETIRRVIALIYGSYTNYITR